MYTERHVFRVNIYIYVYSTLYTYTGIRLDTMAHVYDVYCTYMRDFVTEKDIVRA